LEKIDDSSAIVIEVFNVKMKNLSDENNQLRTEVVELSIVGDL